MEWVMHWILWEELLVILLIVSRYVNTVYHQHTLYSTCVCVSVSDTVNRYSRDALSTLALARALGFIGRNSKILLTIRKSTMAPNEDYTSIRLLDRSHDGSEKEHQRSGHPILAALRAAGLLEEVEILEQYFVTAPPVAVRGGTAYIYML